MLGFLYFKYSNIEKIEKATETKIITNEKKEDKMDLLR